MPIEPLSPKPADALGQSTGLYEVLIRFDDGAFRGAHAIDRKRISDGVEVLAEIYQPARALTLLEVQALVAGLPRIG